MNFRPAFWSGVLLGAFTVFAALLRQPLSTSVAPPDPLLDFVSEAVLAGDASGQITSTNAARTLFGADLAGYFQLCYPTGQPVPPGQLPLACRRFSLSHFLLTDTDGQTRTLEATARLLPGGGTAATFRDVTAHTIAEAKETQAQAEAAVLQALCHRLEQAQTADAAIEAAAETALALGADTARGFVFDAEAKQVTLAAARPDTRAKRLRTQNAAWPETAAFDAANPLHWAMYVAKEPYQSAEMLALPLTAGGAALGHLEMTAGPAPGRAALRRAASLTASTLAARHQSERADAGAAREAGLSEIALLLAQAAPLNTVCDAAATHLRRLLAAEVCTVTINGRLQGRDYHDSLLRPERHKPEDPALQHEAAEAARMSGQTAQRFGLKSPAFADAVWRAFAGASGLHRVLAVPLRGKHAGVLTVWAAGGGVFNAAQVQCAETVAALLSACPATAKAGRTKPQMSPGPAGAN